VRIGWPPGCRPARWSSLPSPAPGNSSMRALGCAWCASSLRATCARTAPASQRPDCMELELGLNPDEAARLPRLALLAPLKAGRARSRPIRIVWHDSADGTLAEQGLALAEQRPGWRLERLRPCAEAWPPGMPAPVLAEGRDPTSLGCTLPDPLVPLAAFTGRAVSMSLAGDHGPVVLTVLNGAVRAVARRASRQPDPVARRGAGSDLCCAVAGRRIGCGRACRKPGGRGDFGHAQHVAAAAARGPTGVACRAFGCGRLRPCRRSSDGCDRLPRAVDRRRAGRARAGPSDARGRASAAVRDQGVPSSGALPLYRCGRCRPQGSRTAAGTDA